MQTVRRATLPAVESRVTCLSLLSLYLSLPPLPCVCLFLAFLLFPLHWPRETRVGSSSSQSRNSRSARARAA
jgi:hypothetical protein